MKKKLIFSLMSAGILAGCSPSNIEYPSTKKVDQVDDYHGTSVADPYRWLEVDTAKAVMEWVNQQNQVTFNYLNQIEGKEGLKTELETLYNYEKYSAPRKAGDYYLFYKNDGLQNQSVIYIQKGLDGEAEVLLDPNTLSEDGTVTANLVSISKDHKYATISINQSGSDWTNFKVLELATKKFLEDEIKWAKFSGTSWYKDGFFYSSYGMPEEGTEYSAKNEFHKVYYHKLGTPQSTDELVYWNKDEPLRNFFGAVTKDQSHLIIGGSEGTYGQEIFFKKLDGNADFQLLFPGFDYEYSILDFKDDKGFLVYTNQGAPNFRVVWVNPNNPSMDQWTEVIPEQELPLAGISMGGNKLFASYLKDVSSEVKQYQLDGTLDRIIELPGIGTVSGFSGEPEDQQLFYTFSSYLAPPVIMQYDIATGKSEVFKASEFPIDLNQFETTRIFFTSKDGTKVPMFVNHKKGITLDGSNPTLLYGYGGFSINILPRFKPDMIWLMEQGGVYAVANIRGGLEYGEEWHKAGMLHNKQNVFDDFIAAAEHLIETKYTSKEKLAISGRSNGGLLVGACMTQRPDLFAVAFPAVGVLDMLRYHKFTIGWAWASEYGSADDAEHFENLYRYSPLHNLQAGTNYPATMISTADHDDRVVPAHSFKFAAALQEAHKGCEPVLIRIDKKAGHGAGKPISMVIEEQADHLAFMFENMKLSLPTASAGN